MQNRPPAKLGSLEHALGEILLERRLALDLTQREVEARAGVGHVLPQYESGRSCPSVGQLARIARALGTRASQLVEAAELRRANHVRVKKLSRGSPNRG